MKHEKDTGRLHRSAVPFGKRRIAIGKRLLFDVFEATFGRLVHLLIKGFAGDLLKTAFEEQCLNRLRLGDASALAELYSHFRLRIYRYALKLTNNRDIAEDVVQETFLKASRAFAEQDDVQSVTAWLFSVARREVLMAFRRSKKDGVALSEEDLWDEKTPADVVIGIETTEIVRSMIAGLKSEYREVILLREYEGLSYAEIALITGDTTDSVKSRLFKARKELLAKLRPFFDSEGHHDLQ